MPIVKFAGDGPDGTYYTSSFTAQEEQYILNQFRILPIGARVGKRFTPSEKNSFTFDIYGGLSPMYFLKIWHATNLGVKINWRLFKYT